MKAKKVKSQFQFRCLVWTFNFKIQLKVTKAKCINLQNLLNDLLIVIVTYYIKNHISCNQSLWLFMIEIIEKIIS